MYLDASGKYSAFEELMSYYNLNFYAYYILVSIVLINCIKAIIDYYNIRNGNISRVRSSGYNQMNFITLSSKVMEL